MNRPEIELGPELTNYKDFAMDLTPELRGLTIGNSPTIQTAHNSFAAYVLSPALALLLLSASRIRLQFIHTNNHHHHPTFRPEIVSVDAQKATSDDDVFHFIGYVPVGGKVYELDGLQEGPILLGNVR
jgi:ubiquitin carboxyl-terminal hydrolase L5